MDRHHYKYVVVDSSKHINQSVNAEFTVQIPHGLNNCSRVCVKSFSMPNNFHNVYGDIKNVQWVEFYKTAAGAQWKYKVFTASLNDGYFLTSDLVTQIQTTMNTTNNRFDSETGATTTFSFSHDTTTLHNSIIPNSGANKHKIFFLYSDYDHNVWRNLGFSNNKIIHDPGVLDEIRTYLNDNYNDGVALPTVDQISNYNTLIKYNHVLLRKYHTLYAYNNTGAVSIKSDFVGHNENHPMIYIASKKLSNDFLKGIKYDDKTVTAHKSDHIAVINVSVPKFSHITYSTDTPMWNHLENKNITSFDIQIQDYTGQTYPRTALADFILVLMFEEIKEIEFSKEEKIAYLDYAYKLAH